MRNTDLWIQVIALGGIVLPLIAERLSARNRLRSTVYLLELIKTREDLETIIEAQEQRDSSPVLLAKLKRLREEIEMEVTKEDSGVRLHVYPVIMALEVVLLYLLMNPFLHYVDRVMGTVMHEGVMKYSNVHLALAVLVSLVTVGIALPLGRFVLAKIRSNVLYNIAALALFNTIWLINIGMMLVILRVIEPFTKLF